MYNFLRLFSLFNVSVKRGREYMFLIKGFIVYMYL